MIQKYFEGKIPENCVRNPSPQTQMCEESLKAYKLDFGFKDCLLVKTFQLESRLVSETQLLKPFSTFTTYFGMHNEA